MLHKIAYAKIRTMEFLAVPFLILTAILFTQRNRSRTLRSAFNIMFIISTLVIVGLIVLTILVLTGKVSFAGP